MCRTVSIAPSPDRLRSTHTQETTNKDVATMTPSSTIRLRGAVLEITQQQQARVETRSAPP